VLEECSRRSCSFGEDAAGACGNRAIARRAGRKVAVRPTPGKGWGLFAAEDIAAGDFVLEYVGEVIDDDMCAARLAAHKRAGTAHFHMMELAANLVIDAGAAGNEARFINHSCAPNCRAEKWRVGGEERVGIFANVAAARGTELTYDYQFVAFGEHWRCACGEPACRRFLGMSARELERMRYVAGIAGLPVGAAGGLGRARDAAAREPRVDATGRPVARRGRLCLPPLNPCVLGAAARRPAPRAPFSSDPSALHRLFAGVNLGDDEIDFVRLYRVFISGSRPRAPSFFVGEQALQTAAAALTAPPPPAATAAAGAEAAARAAAAHLLAATMRHAAPHFERAAAADVRRAPAKSSVRGASSRPLVGYGTKHKRIALSADGFPLSATVDLSKCRPIKKTGSPCNAMDWFPGILVLHFSTNG